MRVDRSSFTTTLLVLALLAVGSSAAAEVNDPACTPSPEHPYPVVLAHGRSGHITDLVAITEALEAAGACVYGVDYGRVNGTGQTGLDHLAISGGQIEAFVAEVLAMTGATKVDVVGYSEGTGVLNDFILAKGGAVVVHRLVSFGGLHHPYAHASASGFADSDVFLPNLIVEARRVVPGITAQQVITGALDLYAAAGGQLAGVDHEVATSPFASDLFDPTYWSALHGSLSEPEGTILRLVSSGHGLPTDDAAPSVCYTNIVSSLDPITGPSAGFQQPAANVENVLLTTGADHGTIISDPVAIATMLSGLASPCVQAGDDGDPGGGGDGGDGGGGDNEGGPPLGAGCATTRPASATPWLLVALAAWRSRRRRSR